MGLFTGIYLFCYWLLLSLIMSQWVNLAVCHSHVYEQAYLRMGEPELEMTNTKPMTVILEM